jgi:4-amino-4-deoxy-L-arabinose transferase-like glycosyltransferase
VVTAPLNGPDEVAHFAYAEHLAQTGHGPNAGGGDGPTSTTAATALVGLGLQAILLHPEAKPVFSAVDRVEAQMARQPASDRKNGSGPNAAANYPPLYYAYEGVVYRLSPARGLLGQLFFMRLATTALFVATVWLTWLIAAELLASTWARFLATAFVALQPKLGFVGGIINPDMMLVLAATGALLMGLRLVRRGPSLGLALGLAAFAGAGVLVHPRGLFLPPFAVVALVIGSVRHWPGRRSAALAAATVLGVTIACVVIAAAWTRSHGAALASNPVGGFSPKQFLSYLWQFYLPKLSFMAPKVGPPLYGYRQVYIDTYFSSFGSLTVSYRREVLDFLQVAAGIGLAALWTTVVARWRTVLARWPEVVLCVTFFGALMGLMHIVSYLNLRGSTDPVLNGRYLLPACALYGAAIAWVVSSLPRRAGVVVGGALLGVALVLAIGGVGLSLDRFYA